MDNVSLRDRCPSSLHVSRMCLLFPLRGTPLASLLRAAFCINAVTTGLAAAQPPASRSARVTAFIDVNVVPMDTNRVLPHQTVIVDRGRIMTLGATTVVRVPRRAVRIDGRGKYLIPGLADMHTHVLLTANDSAGIEQQLFLWIANGATTIRNVDFSAQGTGIDPSFVLGLARRTASGALLGPHIYTSGAVKILTSGTAQMQTASPITIEKQLEDYKAHGYDYLKIHPDVNDEGPPTFYDSVFATAKRLGIPIVGHIHSRIGLERSLQSYTSIEHLYGYLPYLYGNEPPPSVYKQPPYLASAADTAEYRKSIKPFDFAKIPYIAEETRRAKVWNCPTLISAEVSTNTEATIEPWTELRYYGPSVTHAQYQLWLSTYHHFGTVNSGFSVMEGTGALDAFRKIVKGLQDAGAGLLTGTDAPTLFLVPGFSLQRELQAFVNAGLTPYQALVASTRNVAVYFGTLNERGTIARGKRADLVLLRGNPLNDIDYTRRPDGVMIDGRWIGRAEIDERLAQLTVMTAQ